jgi:hypothetical protein
MGTKGDGSSVLICQSGDGDKRGRFICLDLPKRRWFCSALKKERQLIKKSVRALESMVLLKHHSERRQYLPQKPP